MEVTKYTLELTNGEMFSLAYALENSIESGLKFLDNKKFDPQYEDYEEELDLLDSFITNYGYSMSIYEKTPEGDGILGTSKSYDCAEEWFRALIKQRRKEYDTKNATTE